MAQDSIRPFVAPTIVFGVVTMLEGYVPARWYPLVYSAKAIAVTWALVRWRVALRDIRPSLGTVVPSVAIGLAMFVAWVGIDKAIAYPHLGSRAAFDPYTLPTVTAAAAFLAIRFSGLVLMVPVMEEVFWRSFLLRYVTSPRFLDLPMGTFSLRALCAVVGASMIAHPEWLPAGVASLVYCLWLQRTRSLFSTVVAHATTNAALGAYILVTREWRYW